MNNNTMLEEALAYARKGVHVFPCKPRDKPPATQNSFKDASKEEEQIRRWWTENPEYNIGVPTGEQNGFWVLDVDGEEGYESYAKFRGEIGKYTPQVKTGSGGLHLYFTYSEDLSLNNGVRVLPGLDIRADGGYVVAPPSIHESGNSYEWVGESREPTEAPENLVSSLRRRSEGLVSPVEATVEEGSRNATLFRRARSLFRQGYNETEVFCTLWMVNENRCKPMLGKHEVEQVVRSAAKYERGELMPSCRPEGEKKMSKVTSEKVNWLWEGRIPLGKLTIIDGDPGLGKSNITMDLAARVSTGRPFPNGVDVGDVVDVVGLVDVGGVVLMNAEDGLADTIRPRLDAAGGDVDKIVALTEKSNGTLPTIPEDLGMIEESIARNSAKLLIIDPLMAYLSPTVNSHNDQQVRQALSPLTKMAQRLNVAVIVVRHLKKEETSKAVHRGGGSIGIIGAARAAFAVNTDPNDKDRCVFAMTKSNLGRKAPSLTYTITTAENGAAKIVWGESIDLDANDLLSTISNKEPGEQQKAAAWLRGVLAAGPMPSPEFLGAAEEEGINEKTLERAKKDEGVRSKRQGKGWVTYLPNIDKIDNTDKMDKADKQPILTAVS